MFFPIPPVTGSGDEHFSNVDLLLRMNGENDGTTFTDESNDARSLTRSGNTLPVTTTGVVKYGTASAQFPANSSGQPSHLRVTAPSIGTGQFTIEFWMRITTDAVNFTIIDSRYNSSYVLTTGDTAFSIFFSTTKKIRLVYYVSNVATYLNGVTDVSVNTWHHVAVCRDSSNLVRIFLNGSLENSATITSDLSNVYWTIGAVASTTNYSLRYLDDVRLTTGVCRYTENFTPPAAELPNSGGGTIAYPPSIIAPSQLAHPQHQIVRLGL
jgi:hypothetical protein